jgi:spermidine synthase
MMMALLPVASAVSAAAALAIEIAVVRVGAPHVGQTLVPWSAAIVAVLCGLALGHALGGRAGGSDATRGRLRAILAMAWTAAACGALLMPALAARIAGGLAGADGPGLASVAGLAALTAPSSIAAGFALPLLLRLAVTDAGEGAPLRIAAILAGSAGGSVAGCAAAGFLLLETFGATGLARLLALVWLLLAAAIAPWRDAHEGRRRWCMRALAGAAVGVALAPLPHPCDQDTRYTCIRLVDQPLPEGGMLRFMILDEGVHSASDRDAPTRLHLGYAALADRLARPVLDAAAAPRALVVGGGGATLPRAWAAAVPGIRIVVAELDDRVATTAERAMWAGSPAIETRIGDGRAVLRALPPAPSFDVVLMDAYRTHSVPPHLVTREYAALVRARLAPGGVYLSNVIDRAASMQLAAAVVATLREIFPRVEVWVPDIGTGGLTNVVVAAWVDERPHRVASLDVPAIIRETDGTARESMVRWRSFDIDAVRARWPGACAQILTDDRAPVDRLLAGRQRC